MRYGQIHVYGGHAPKQPWPNTTTTTITLKEDYQLQVTKTWIGSQWQIQIQRTIGTQEHTLELYLSGDELTKLKDAL